VIEQAPNRSRVVVITFYGASAFVASLGLSILLASANIAYAVAQSLK
jgi:hypothetical protein